jgi:hypothetical protein
MEHTTAKFQQLLGSEASKQHVLAIVIKAYIKFH